MADSFLKEHTVSEEIELSGVGLHTGKSVRVVVKPAPSSTGVVIRRINGPFRRSVKAYCKNISCSHLATTIGINGTGVSTVEHLMSALLGCGIDNAFVDVEGPEVPAGDGSAYPFVDLIRKVGIKEQDKDRLFFKVVTPLEIREGDVYAAVKPSKKLIIEYSIDFDHPCIGYQYIKWSFDVKGFAEKIARARTFGFLKDVEALKNQGLALGGSLENAIVFDDDSILNPEGMRFRDECVRHKVLDLLGDIMLLGKPLLGHFVLHKAGHKLHHRILGLMLNDVVPVPEEEFTMDWAISFDPLCYEKIEYNCEEEPQARQAEL